MNQLAGDFYNQLADSITEFNPMFYDMLLSLLISHSFNIPPENVAKKVREAMPIFADKIRDSTHTNVHNLKIAEDVAKHIGFYDIHGSKREDETRLIFEATLVVILYIGIRRNIYHRPSIRFYIDFADLQRDYDLTVPGFEDSSVINAAERTKLVYSANYMKTILLLVPNPKGKRAHLLDIVTRLSEGKHKKYITGTGQSVATLRRVQIYQKESGIVPTTRPPRFKDIVGIIMEENVSGEEVTDKVVQYLSETRPNEPYEVQAYSFVHPTDAGVKVDAVEVTSGTNLLTSMSMSRGPGYEISRSLSVATIVPAEMRMDNTINRGLSDMSELNPSVELLQTLDELIAEPLPGMELTTQTVEESFGIVREVSMSRQFPGSIPPDTSEPDYYSWVKGLQLPEMFRSSSFSKSDTMRLRSISQYIGFQNQSNESREDNQPILSLANGSSSQVVVRSFSFSGPSFGETMTTNGESDSLASLSSFMSRSSDRSTVSYFSDTSDARSSLKRDRDDDSLEPSRKVSKKDWDALLDF